MMSQLPAVEASASAPAGQMVPLRNPSRWSTGCSDCFDETDSCLLSCCCPCVQYAKNYVVVKNAGPGQPLEEVVRHNQTACLLCALADIFTCHLAGAIAQCLNRGALRGKHGILTGQI